MTIRDFSDQISSYLEKLHSTMSRVPKEDISRVLGLFMKAYHDQKPIYVMGNGGSAATASHMVTDFNKGVSYGKSKRFKMIALNDNIPSLMAISNDIDYESVFVEQLKNHFNPGDYVLGISGSGNSKNVLRAIEYANSNGGVTIGWSGYSGGELKKIAQHSIHIAVDDMQIAEDAHLILNHLMMQILCQALE